ncbi:MAG: twin transmembrane helix small protein [Burkholderiales bacterium]
MLTKIFIVTILVLIIASLGSALALLFRKDGEKNRMAQALTVRVALSIGLFLTLLAGYYFGLIPMHGLR